MNIKAIMSGMLLALSLSACAVTPPSPAQERAENTVTAMPAWFTSNPTDDRFLFAAGTDTSADPQFAVDRALLAATRSLALQRSAHIAATSRDFVSENGAVDARRQSGQADRATKLSVSTMLGQYTVVETKMIPINGQYRAYVLVKGQKPEVSVAAIVDDKTKAAEKSEDDKTAEKAKKAYMELEGDIKASGSSEPPAPKAQPRAKVEASPTTGG
jgi:hypothetical protein